jgi:hypothetical protein
MERVSLSSVLTLGTRNCRASRLPVATVTRPNAIGISKRRDYGFALDPAVSFSLRRNHFPSLLR